MKHSKRSAPDQPAGVNATVTVVVQDGALAPQVAAGDWLELQLGCRAAAGVVVLLETPDGKQWLRRLVPGGDGALRAAATDPAYPDFDQFTVLACAVRRWSPCSSI